MKFYRIIIHQYNENKHNTILSALYNDKLKVEADAKECKIYFPFCQIEVVETTLKQAE